MVKVVLRGGLGNQMFQYALGLVIADNNNVPLVLDTTLLNDRFPRNEVTFRTFDLDIFTLTPRFTVLSAISKKVPIPGLWAGLDIISIGVGDLLGIRKLVKEKQEYRFEPNVLKSSGNMTLWGFWHTGKYFADHAEKIKSEFHFTHRLTGEAKTIAEKIAASNSVSVHIRRGDYISYKSVHSTVGEVGAAYYKKASEYIAAHGKDPHFFIFSDDIEWCKEHIKFPFSTTYVGADSAGPKSSFHLQLMSLCKNNIIANSTFSWWGAWLNNNAGKIVVAPKQWRVDDLDAARAIIPEGWVTI